MSMNSLEGFRQHPLYDFHVCTLIKSFTGPRPTWQSKLDQEHQLDSYLIHLKDQVIHIRFLDGWSYKVPIQQMRTWIENTTMYRAEGYHEIKLNYKIMKDIVFSFQTCNYCGLQKNCSTSRHCSSCSVRRYCPECYPEFLRATRRVEECDFIRSYWEK